MARNGSGVYSKVNTFVSGNTVTAAGHNQNWDDLVSEMTNSVAADGQTTMTGPLKAASGTVGAPGVTFASDPDCGLYRIGANNIGVAVNGAKVIDVATTGATVTGDMNATTVKQGGFALVPVGTVFPYAGSSAPTGYLLCDGSAVSRTTYAALFAIISTTYGAGNGTTTFNVPNTTGRVIAGKESSATRLTSTYFGGDSTVLGATGGSESHTLTTAQLASHTHVNTLNDTGHVHAMGGAGSVLVSSGGGVYTAGASGGLTGSNNTNSATTGVTITNASAGSGNAHNNVQPTIILNHIIFAGV